MKIGKYFESLRLIGRAFSKKKEELAIENQAQPKAFASIPTSMWWGVATLTTVGYGDIYPITALGKFFGAIISLLGIGLFVLPTGILGSGFVEEIQNRKK